ncbi:MAG TPA: hypothetical protein VM779_13930 [Thermoanaerobaculia bacterium]|nr:hypothetical protein [Thermoanaerobaculia bacterium]
MAPRSSLSLVLLLLFAPATYAGVDVSAPPAALAVTAKAGAIASNGNGFLAVFTRDYTTWSSGLVALDRNGERVNEIANFASHGTAFVAPLGDHYLLSSASANDSGHLAIVSPSAEIVGDWKVEGLPPAPYGEPYEIYTTRSGNLVLLVNRPGNTGYLVSGSGELLRTLGLQPTTAIAADTDRFHLIHVNHLQNGDLVVEAVDASGPSGAPLILERRAAGRRPVAAVMGDRLVIAWERRLYVNQPAHGDQSLEVFTSVVSPAGVVEEERRLTVIEPGFPTLVSLTTTGGEAILVTSRGTQVFAVPIDRDGRTLSAPVQVSGITSAAAAASNGERVVVHGTDVQAVGSKSMAVSFAATDPSLQRAVPTSITRAAQLSPQVAGDGVESLVVWREATAAGDALKARRVSPVHGPLGETITIARTDGKFGEHHAVAAGGGMYLVVWHLWQQIYAARVTTGGLLLDAEPFLVADVADFPRYLPVLPRAASDGSRFLVTWGSRDGAIVSTSGDVQAVADLVERQLGLSIPFRIIDLGWDGTSYVVLFAQTWAILPDRTPSSVLAKRVSAQGRAIPQTTVHIADVVSLAAACLASGPAGSLVTFADRGIHLDAESLAPGPSFPIVQSFDTIPKAQFDGRDFVFAVCKSPPKYVVNRVTAGSTSVRRFIIPADADLAVGAPIQVAVTVDGTAAVITQELHADGREIPVERIVMYLHEEMFRDVRRRSAGR